MAEPMESLAQQVQQTLVADLRAHWQDRYHAYQAQHSAPPTPAFLQAQPHLMGQPDALPLAVLEAYRFYQDKLVEQDRGRVSLAHSQVAGNLVYVVTGQSDGDDGWLEVYDQQGTGLGFGRTYLELVAWVDQATLRSQVDTGAFPPTLDPSQTLWGQ